MNRIINLVFFIVIGLGICNAQNISELFNGDDFLTGIFVNPLGIRNLPDTKDPACLERKISDAGVEYKSVNLGPFGTMFGINPKTHDSSLKIGEVEISGIGVCVNNDAVMVIYQSKATDNHKNMPKVLDTALRNYAKDITQSDYYTIYMLTDKYGIAVGADDVRQTAIACLLDIRNLQGFLGLGTLTGS